jgi:hypothetical protein
MPKKVLCTIDMAQFALQPKPYKNERKNTTCPSGYCGEFMCETASHLAPVAISVNERPEIIFKIMPRKGDNVRISALA